VETPYKIVLSLVLVTALAGCSRNQDADDKDGRMIRVDKSTGVVTVMDGDRITRVKTPEEQTAEDRDRDEFAKTRNMPILGLAGLGGGNATLRLSWHDGKVFYRFSIAPTSKQIEAARSRPGPSFEILLDSAEGSVVKKIEVQAESMTLNRNDPSDTSSALTRDDSAPCAMDDYRRIASWDISWSGFATE